MKKGGGAPRDRALETRLFGHELDPGIIRRPTGWRRWATIAFSLAAVGGLLLILFAEPVARSLGLPLVIGTIAACLVLALASSGLKGMSCAKCDSRLRYRTVVLRGDDVGAFMELARSPAAVGPGSHVSLLRKAGISPRLLQCNVVTCPSCAVTAVVGVNLSNVRAGAP